MRELFVAVVVVVAIAGPVAGASGGNEPPLADAGLDQEVEHGQTVVLDGTGSRDPDGSIRSYSWSITAPDGSTIEPDCSTCSRTRFAAQQVGRYEVSVQVTDDDGMTRRDTLYVDVESSGSPPSDSGEEGGDPSDSDGNSGTSEVSEGGTGNGPNVARSATNSSGDACSADEIQVGSDCRSGIDLEPVVIVDGPSQVAVEETAPFTTRTAGFADGPLSYAWSPSDRGPGTTTSWVRTGTKTVFVSVGGPEGGTATDRKKVDVVENEQPIVKIANPTPIEPGETVTLSLADKRDPDGHIVDTTWHGGPTVSIPTDGDPVSIHVTVTDDDGASATDQISINGKSEEANRVKKVICVQTHAGELRRTACYDRTEGGGLIGSGEFLYDINLKGYEKYKIVVQHRYMESKEELKSPPDKYAEVAVPEEESETIDNTRKGTLQNPDSAHYKEELESKSSMSTKSMTINGKTVKNDLNGDGEVNAQDWDQRYRSESGSDSVVSEEAIETVRGQHRAAQATHKGSSLEESQDDVSGSESDSDQSQDGIGWTNTRGSWDSESNDSSNNESQADQKQQKADRLIVGPT